MQKRHPTPKASPRARGNEREQTRDAGRQRPMRDEEFNVRSVRLTRKYAEMIDGVDLADANVGDELRLSTHDAEMLIAEGWAEPTADCRLRRRSTDVQSTAPDRGNRRTCSGR